MEQDVGVYDESLDVPVGVGHGVLLGVAVYAGGKENEREVCASVLCICGL